MPPVCLGEGELLQHLEFPKKRVCFLIFIKVNLSRIFSSRLFGRCEEHQACNPVNFRCVDKPPRTNRTHFWTGGTSKTTLTASFSKEKKSEWTATNTSRALFARHKKGENRKENAESHVSEHTFSKAGKFWKLKLYAFINFTELDELRFWYLNLKCSFRQWSSFLQRQFLHCAECIGFSLRTCWQSVWVVRVQDGQQAPAGSKGRMVCHGRKQSSLFSAGTQSVAFAYSLQLSQGISYIATCSKNLTNASPTSCILPTTWVSFNLTTVFCSFLLFRNNGNK